MSIFEAVLVSSDEGRNPRRMNSTSQEAVAALRAHWPEYLMEAGELGLFMISACAFSLLIFHPASPISHAIPNEILKRLAMGTAMGSTSVAIVFSRFGKRSGAHFNPAVTLAYLRLGKVKPWDAAFYTLFQFCGGIFGVVLSSMLFGDLMRNKAVNYAATVPGRWGVAAAFTAEVAISFLLMLTVLTISNTKKLARWTGLFAGALIVTYISFESPISGMSMNPARTFGSASVGSVWTSLWIYFTAPPIGMLLAAETRRRSKMGQVACAKLHHHNNQRCIFQCNFEK